MSKIFYLPQIEELIMKLQLQDLVNAELSLANLMQERVPASIAYKLGRLQKEAGRLLKPFYEARAKLFKDLGEAIPNGKPSEMQIKKENMEQFQKEMKELVEVEVELLYEPLELEKLGELKLSGADMANIEMFFKS